MKQISSLLAATLLRLNSVEEGEGSITVNWTSQGYDVYLELRKKDEDNISGSLMDMFSASGQRIKE